MDPKIAEDFRGLAKLKAIDEVIDRGDSDVQRFYNNLTVFFTGGTGFIGKHLIEKLFRSCEIKKAYVLIRPKKGKAMKERLQEMLSDPVFETVRVKKPYFAERIVAVPGDIAEIGLAMDKEDWKTITDEVDVIFHVAATIRFDEAIRKATLTNVRGTRETLKLGKACKNIKSFVHVSTAYSHTTSPRSGGDMMETFYPSPATPDLMIQLAEKDTDELEKVTDGLSKDWPNTYTFTKAIAEEVVRTESDNIKVTIVRPSIVLCSYIEPTPGWMDVSCMYGPSGIIVGVALGLIRVLYLNNKLKLSLLPVDYVNNATIVAGWDAAVKTNNEIKIFNISTTNSGITFKHISTPMRSKCRTIMTPLAMWYVYLFETNNRAIYWVLCWLLHYIPAYTIDAAMKIFRLKKPKELKSFVHAYKKYDKFSKVFEYFLTNEWNFDEKNLKGLQNRMSLADKKIYNFDINDIDWDWFTMVWCLGVRKFILKDGLKGTRGAIRNQKWLKLANYGMGVFYLYIVWILINFIVRLFILINNLVLILV